MERFDYLIVGGGLAAASAVDGIRSVDPEGTIAILTDEGDPPYHRPPLSKEYLQTPAATRDLLYVKPVGWFEEEARVTVRTDHRTTALDPKEMAVITEDGSRLGGDRILIATGARPRTLDVSGSELDGVFTLRSAEDSERIRALAGDSEEAVLVGAGFIGMEVAASLTRLGVRPTVIELEDRVWPHMLPPTLSYFVQGYFEERGVRFETACEPEEFRGVGRVEAVVIRGGTDLLCQLTIVGLGVRPNEELAGDAGLAVLDGIVVDKFGETSHGHIYAAGDVARFPDPVFGDMSRVEHWDHAKAHGKLVGRNMAGAREPYEHVSHFFSDVFDLSLNVFGRPAVADEVIVLGELTAERSVVVCGQDGRLTGAVLANANDLLETCRTLLKEREPLEEVAAKLEEALGELEEVPS